MEKETKKEPKESKVSLSEQIDKQIESILEKGINTDNITYLGKLIDINKDCENIKYWKEKISMYRESGSYNEGYGRYRDGGYNDGGYNEGGYNAGSYGRRGVKGTGRGRYRGEEMMNDMYSNYSEYSYGRENYGADQATLKSLNEMLESVKKFMKHLEQEASSREEVEMIKKAAKEISMM